MEYKVQVVGDDELPAGSPWVFVVTNDMTLLLVTRSKVLTPLAVCGIMAQVFRQMHPGEEPDARANLGAAALAMAAWDALRDMRDNLQLAG